MKPAEKLLERLHKVRGSSPRWRALCPAHENKNTLSLAVTELEDGRLLVKCFAGCETSDALGAVGLSLSDLFPKPLGDRMPPINKGHYVRAERKVEQERKEKERIAAENHELIQENIRLRELLNAAPK